MSVIERFLKYVSLDTTSNEDSETVPSSACQLALGELLVGELCEIGLQDVRMDEYGYVYGFLPASTGRENEPALGLIAHMDTSPAVSGKDIKARIVTYTGGVLTLESGAELDPALYPMLNKCVGKELIVTDGTTLLGADDKAGIAEIVSACAHLCAHPEISHRAIAVAFTPDEEIGRGADHFDVAHFGAPVAYTVDGGEIGEIEYENFNAAAARLTVHGVNIHPGSAKNRMKNAVLMANQFISMLPPAETPAHTEGYEGFYHVTDMQGDETTATVSMLIRDHDRAEFEARKAFLSRLCDYLNGEWGSGSFELSVRDSYYNMREKLLDHMELIENAKAAMRSVGVEPIVMPIRGGTDGARLSFMGLPCPNLSTGGANFHGVHEFIPVESLCKMVDVLLYLVG
ncbi:MAG: peptidase T [Clostridia bacterium]|nr:peptidase T [Clostridia bacterium]